MNTKRYEILYNRIIEQHIRKIFHTQKATSARRKHNEPMYDIDSFTLWMKKQPNFSKLYNNWIDSDFDKNLTPSCDRLDATKGYSFDNIELVTWRENLIREVKRKSTLVKVYKINGDFLKEFSSISEAARFFDSDIRNYSSILNNKKLYDEKNDIFITDGSEKMFRQKIADIEKYLKTIENMKVYQYDLGGNFIGVYDNIKDAADKNNLSRSRILESIKSKKRTSGGYIWIREYSGYIENVVKQIISNNKTLDPRKKSIVKCDLNGFIIKEYDSISDVTIDGLSKGTVGQALNGLRKSAYGHIWLYKENASLKNIQSRLSKITKK